MRKATRMSAAKDGDGRNGVQVIARAAEILRALKGAHGMSLGQIAERVGLPRSTVQRIVGALQAERLVIASKAGAGIRLGPELHALAEAARYNLVEMMRPMLEALARETGETVDLSVMRGDAMVFIDQIAGTHRLRAVSAVGEAFPITSTANGKACLALLEDEEVRAVAEREWAGDGESHDLAALMAEIAAIRRTGLALDDGEHTDGISAVGIAFSDLRGDKFAISIPAPSGRFRSNRPALERALAQLRAPIADMFGR